MSAPALRGKKEDLKLEFKEKAVLEKPEKVAREVVAMLNAEGGDVWVGVKEDKGTAVALEAVADPEKEKRRLQDFLVDTIEPAPSASEVAVQVVASEDGALLRVRVAPDPCRQPYAWTKETGRHYVVRLDGRIRPLEREEIRQRFLRSGSPDKEEIARAEQELTEELTKAQRDALTNSAERFWLRVKPVPGLSLNLDALYDSDLLLDPALTGNRRVGKTYFLAVASGGGPRHGRDCLAMGKAGSLELKIFEDGGLLFVAPLRAFHAGAEGEAKKPLDWEALFELPISIFRLLSAMLKDEKLWEERPAPITVFLSGLAILGARGWSLRPFSPALHPSAPGLPWWRFLMFPPRELDDPDLLLTPVRISFQDVLNEPDRCGFRLVRRIYAAFGYSLDDIPLEYDQKAGRLILPE